jgi:hypothetical protein
MASIAGLSWFFIAVISSAWRTWRRFTKRAPL